MRSCGILLYRPSETGELEVWLGHMGGPFWARKDAAAWSIPKGEPEPGEADLAAALREFAEEIGTPAPAVDYVLLGEFAQRSGKIVVVFAGLWSGPLEFGGSNTFETEWPPRSGRRQSFPEIDKAEWMSLTNARVAVVAGQRPVLDALETHAGQ